MKFAENMFIGFTFSESGSKISMAAKAAIPHEIIILLCSAPWLTQSNCAGAYMGVVGEADAVPRALFSKVSK